MSEIIAPSVATGLPHVDGLPVLAAYDPSSLTPDPTGLPFSGLLWQVAGWVLWLILVAGVVGTVGGILYIAFIGKRNSKWAALGVVIPCLLAIIMSSSTIWVKSVQNVSPNGVTSQVQPAAPPASIEKGKG